MNEVGATVVGGGSEQGGHGDDRKDWDDSLSISSKELPLSGGRWRVPFQTHASIRPVKCACGWG